MAASTASRSRSPTISPCRPAALNIRVGDQALDKEARLHDYKRPAPSWPSPVPTSSTASSPAAAPRPEIGIITTGKSYLDVRAAMDELGIDEVKANELGIRLYKVGMVWPLEPEGVLEIRRRVWTSSSSSRKSAR